MKISITEDFKSKLADQVEFIARDKPGAARKFKNELLKRIKEIPKMPKKHRKSIFFENENIRDLIYKGYTIVYRIKEEERIIEVFGLTKFEKNPFE